MNAALETGLVAYLNARLTELGQSLAAVPATNRAEQEPRDPRLIAAVRNFQHIAGPDIGPGGIYTAEIALSLQTPILPADDTAAHLAWESLLPTLMSSSEETDLAIELLSAGLTHCGQRFVGWEKQPQPGYWGSAGVWLLGLQIPETAPEPAPGIFDITFDLTFA